MVKKLSILALAFAVMGCVSEKKVSEQLERILEEKPELLAKAIEKKPLVFVESFQKAIRAAQAEMAQKKEEEDKKQMEELFDKPYVPTIEASRVVRGTKGAPLTIVEYSDFECPFCSRGFNTVIELLEKYKGKIQFIYKHLPLDFHKSAEIAALYYEAIALQNHEKAIKFHDEIYKNQRKLSGGEAFLKSIAKQLKVDLKKLEADVKSSEVKKIVEADMEEASKFEMQGTPGFLINGIPVRGALPASEFDRIIEELVKRGKLKL